MIEPVTVRLPLTISFPLTVNVEPSKVKFDSPSIKPAVPVAVNT